MKPGRNVKRIYVPGDGPPQPRRMVTWPRSKPYPYSSRRQMVRNWMKAPGSSNRELISKADLRRDVNAALDWMMDEARQGISR